jgi:hypothetical protein
LIIAIKPGLGPDIPVAVMNRAADNGLNPRYDHQGKGRPGDIASDLLVILKQALIVLPEHVEGDVSRLELSLR